MLVELAGRTVQVKAFPIGIPFERFVKLAETAPKFLNDTEKVKVIIGVDRLDYTKGKCNFFFKNYISFFFNKEKLLNTYCKHILSYSSCTLMIHRWYVYNLHSKS